MSGLDLGQYSDLSNMTTTVYEGLRKAGVAAKRPVSQKHF